MSETVICQPVTPLKVPKAKWKKFEKYNGIKGGDTQVTLFFDNSGGKLNDTRAKYTIEAKRMETEEIIPKKTQISPFIFDGLENGYDYQFTLIASNTTETVRSKVRKMKPLYPPNMPYITKITNHPQQREIHLDFECEEHDRFDILAELLGYAEPGKISSGKPVKEGPVILKKLVSGKPYQFRITALNSTAIIENPDLSEPFIPLWVPPKPKLKKCRNSGVKSIEIEWECDDHSIPSLKADYIIEVTDLGEEAKGHKKATVNHYIYEKEQRFHVIENLQSGVKYRVRVIARNAIGKSEPSRPKMITPLELPPAMANIIVNCRPKKGYIQLQWMTKEGDARDPRYNAEYVVRAEPKTDEGEIETSRTHRKIFDVKDGETYVFYVKTRNKIGESEEIASKSVTLRAHHHIVARGNRGIDEMVEFLDNTKVYFALVQLKVGGDRMTRYKNIKIEFVGGRAPLVHRGQAKALSKSMEKLFGSTHTKLEFRDVVNVTTANVFQKASKIILDSTDLSISGKRQSLLEMQQAYLNDMHSSDIRIRDREFRSDSILSTMSDFASFLPAIRLNTTRITQLLKILRQRHGWVDWAMFKPNKEKMELINTNSFGEKGIFGLVDYFQDIPPYETFCIFRILLKNKPMWVVLHYMSFEEQFRKKERDRIMIDRLRPHSLCLDIKNKEDFNVESILSKVCKQLGGRKLTVEKFKQELEDYTTQTNNANIERFVEKILPADKLAGESNKRRQLVKQLIKNVKDVESDINWVIINPADI